MQSIYLWESHSILENEDFWSRYTWLVMTKWLTHTREACDCCSVLYFSIALGSLYIMEWMEQQWVIILCRPFYILIMKAHELSMYTFWGTTLRCVLQSGIQLYLLNNYYKSNNGVILLLVYVYTPLLIQYYAFNCTTYVTGYIRPVARRCWFGTKWHTQEMSLQDGQIKEPTTW